MVSAINEGGEVKWRGWDWNSACMVDGVGV